MDVAQVAAQMERKLYPRPNPFLAYNLFGISRNHWTKSAPIHMSPKVFRWSVSTYIPSLPTESVRSEIHNGAAQGFYPLHWWDEGFSMWPLFARVSWLRTAAVCLLWNMMAKRCQSGLCHLRGSFREPVSTDPGEPHESFIVLKVPAVTSD